MFWECMRGMINGKGKIWPQRKNVSPPQEEKNSAQEEARRRKTVEIKRD